ncbi:DUF1993 domain-containing protein [Sinimarinibacterium sp. CAU 1509]|nr:DUF1993 domain-containing protein [Sinimarinibacterium sp. CAU 1509]
MYTQSVPLLQRALGSLAQILRKAQAHAEARKIDPQVLLSSRLYPDMFALARQVQIATDTAKGCAARLAGEEPPSYEDTESTFDELQARIVRTLDYLQSFRPEQIEGSEQREVTLKLRSGPIQFTGLSYLNGFVLPNIYFHVTTAYAILRHNGVELGKLDYLGQP